VADGQLMLIAGLLLAAGLVASLIAGRLRVPSLLLFLGVGIVAGSDVTGWISFDDYELARTIGVVALAVILFEGGLTAGFEEIRPVLGVSVSLAVLGTLLTALFTGFAAAWLFDLELLQGLLLGSALAATDGAAIFALLRGSTLRRKLARTLEGEAGLNDPVAVLLVLGFIEWIEQPDYGVLDLALLFAQELVIGAAFGLAVGWLAVRAIQRAQLATGGLYPVATLATAALAYGGADVLHGSGFLAVYLAGLALGSAIIPAKQTVTSFHQGLAWVAQLTMFVTLGLLVFPAQLDRVIIDGTVLAILAVVLARPLAVAIASAPWRFSARERIVLGWAGLRGAVPVVLATFAVISDVPDAQEFFNVIFFAVAISTLLQGATFEPLAQRLGLTTNEPALPRPLAEAGTIRRLGAEVVEYEVAPDDAIVGARVRDLGLPREANVTVLVRGDQAIPPRGATRLRAGDRLHLLLRQEASAQVPALLRRWRAGPVGPPPRPPRRPLGRPVVFTVRPWSEADGDPARVQRLFGEAVVDQLRVRRDVPGGLWVLADGRYAVTGPLLAAGGRGDLTAWARRRLRQAESDERAWLQTVIGALASDFPE